VPHSLRKKADASLSAAIGNYWIVAWWAVAARCFEIALARRIRLDAELEASPYDAARWISAAPDDLEKFAYPIAAAWHRTRRLAGVPRQERLELVMSPANSPK